jgi:drug/metabolite transporter superfamily protein YnfA
MSKLRVVSDFWLFLRENKKYWLAPIVIVLLLVGLLLVVAKGSAVAPFIYTLF